MSETILLVMTDGRSEYLTQTIHSLDRMVHGDFTHRVIHDDSGDDDYAEWLRNAYPGFEIKSTGCRSGFSGAIQSAWSHIEKYPFEYVMHLEDDFLFNKETSLSECIELLDAYPHMAQLAFRRQPWGGDRDCGGFINQAPGWYTERSDGRFVWVETRRNWTTNPNIYHRSLLSVGWPDSPHSEGKFGFVLKEDVGVPGRASPEDVVFAFWGGLEYGDEWVYHIGDHRVGTGY